MSNDTMQKTVRIAGGPPEPASRWVWLIARLAPYGDLPKVGDIVVEWSHTLVLARHQLGLHSAIGYLRAIEKDAQGGPVYVIESLDPAVGTRRWENAAIALVEMGRS